MDRGYRRLFVRVRVGDVIACDSYQEEGTLGYAKTSCSGPESGNLYRSPGPLTQREPFRSG
jgi:hypothetical protein